MHLVNHLIKCVQGLVDDNIFAGQSMSELTCTVSSRMLYSNISVIFAEFAMYFSSIILTQAVVRISCKTANSLRSCSSCC